MDYLKILPTEITLDILSRVPTESVLECKLVCTNWRNFVSHQPSFSKMHLHHLNHLVNAADYGKLKGFLSFVEAGELYHFKYNENHDESTKLIQRIRNVNIPCPFWFYSFVGSCDGLICIISRGRSVCVCNPITKEFVVLPEINTHDEYMYGSTSFGVSSTNEYKVLRMYSLNNYVEVQIYTLGSGNGWRNLGKFSFEFSLYRNQAGIFANGALYWMGRKPEMIVTFDLAEEKVHEHLSTPPLPPDCDWIYNSIGVLDGFLYLAISLHAKVVGFYDIWLLRKNEKHGKKEAEVHQLLGWTKEFRNHKRELLIITKNDGVLTYNSLL